MSEFRITEALIASLKKHLILEEKSPATIEKYIRDIFCFKAFVGEKPVTREAVLEYKLRLKAHYAVTSANSMLASINSFFRFLGAYELIVKQFRVQRSSFISKSKELTKAEYIALAKTAMAKDKRLSLIIQTICSTGIRISELKYITVEAVRQSEATVSCKGKIRRIFINSKLRKLLLDYAKERRIGQGSIFVTRTGKPLDRSNIWRQMKALCSMAKVTREKVFPHNLRHLFACVFYEKEKDIAKLSDILGHSSINTTRIYISTSGEAHRRMVENMRLLI